MTTIFAFDAATSRASCALLCEGALLGRRRCEPRELLAAASALIGEHGLSLVELDGLVVGTGPGSFTSIRVALATARALCFGLDLPAAGVSTLRGFGAGRAVIDARRGEVFVAGPALRRPDELEVAGELLVGDGALRHRALFEAAGAEIPPDEDDAHVPDAARLAARAGPFGDAELIEPLYLRAPDAIAPAPPRRKATPAR